MHTALCGCNKLSLTESHNGIFLAKFCPVATNAFKEELTNTRTIESSSLELRSSLKPQPHSPRVLRTLLVKLAL